MPAIGLLYNFQKDFFEKSTLADGLLKVKSNVDVIKNELKSGKDFPVSIGTDFSGLINVIPTLGEAQTALKSIFKEMRTDFKKLISSGSFDEFRENLKELLEVDALSALPDVVKDIVHLQVGLTLSFVSVVLHPRTSPEQIGAGCMESFNKYLFSKDGFKTVSGDIVPRPKLPRDAGELKSIGNPINAERYIRDITRIIVETAGDSIYGTRDRYSALKKKFGGNPAHEKLVSWFDSFGDSAEVSVLPVVEETLNGAFGMELNPLIAAAAGTFCSVSARKATEHCYLTLLDIRELKDVGPTPVAIRRN